MCNISTVVMLYIRKVADLWKVGTLERMDLSEYYFSKQIVFVKGGGYLEKEHCYSDTGSADDRVFMYDLMAEKWPGQI